MSETSGRRERFERVWEDHHARVFGYVLRRAASADDAADAVADTFLVAWRRLDDAPAENTHLWLYAVARRVLANQRRGASRRTQLAERLRHELSAQTPLATPADLAELTAAFHSLPERDRELLALDAWEQLDIREIAEVLGCSRNAIRIRLHRARRRLRAAMGPAAAAAGERPPALAAEPAVAKGDLA